MVVAYENHRIFPMLAIDYWDDNSPLCCCEYYDKKQQRSHILGCCCYCDELDNFTDKYDSKFNIKLNFIIRLPYNTNRLIFLVYYVVKVFQ